MSEDIWQIPLSKVIVQHIAKIYLLNSYYDFTVLAREDE